MMNSRLAKPILIGLAVIIPIILIAVFIVRMSSPDFPETIPSSEKKDKLDVSNQAQIEFFNQFTRYIRDNHGGLILAEGLKDSEEQDSEKQTKSIRFRHTFRSINNDLLFKLIQRFADGLLTQYQIRKYSYKDKALNKPDFYEVEFLKNAKPWIVVKMEWQDTVIPEKKESIQYTEVTDVAQKDQMDPVEGKTEKPQLVIIIDDLGYNMEVFNKLITIDQEITYAILPQLAFSLETAETVNKKGHDIILHLPMQPKEWPKYDPGNGALLISDDSKTIQKKMASNFESVPYIVGVNNHMGSAYTQHKRGLDVLMTILKEKELFFLDSKTAPGDISKRSAKSKGVRFLSRNIFLDNIQNPDYVRNQLYKAVKISKKWGKAIVIGHPYEVTYQVLSKELPLLEEQGIHIARITDIL